MKRREFMKIAAAFTAWPQAALLNDRPRAESVADFSNLAEAALEAEDESFFVFLHPSTYASIVAIHAREKWRQEWRRQRLARQGIFEAHGMRWHGPVIGWHDPMPVEIGRIDGVRIIELEEVPR